MGDKFNRLFRNTVDMPRLRSVDATIDLLPERRMATVETAWAETTEVEAGSPSREMPFSGAIGESMKWS